MSGDPPMNPPEWDLAAECDHYKAEVERLTEEHDFNEAMLSGLSTIFDFDCSPGETSEETAGRICGTIGEQHRSAVAEVEQLKLRQKRLWRAGYEAALRNSAVWQHGKQVIGRGYSTLTGCVARLHEGRFDKLYDQSVVREESSEPVNQNTSDSG